MHVSEVCVHHASVFSVPNDIDGFLSRSMKLNEPMSEEEARQWQELCDLELARKLQQEEEEESKWRRDVSDLSTRLAIEARDRELAQTLQEKEKARLRKAKEKARLKAMQKASQQQQKEHHYQHLHQHQPYDYHQYNEHPAESHHRTERPLSMTDNIAASIDPTWSRRQSQPQPHPPPVNIPPHHPVYQLHHHPPQPTREPPRPLPITDLGKVRSTKGYTWFTLDFGPKANFHSHTSYRIQHKCLSHMYTNKQKSVKLYRIFILADFPVPVQPIVAGQRRGGLGGSHSQPDSPEPSERSPQPARSKSGASCSHQ